MISAASLLSVLLGSAAACACKRYPAYVGALETSAGLLLIGGFALAGCALPVML